MNHISPDTMSETLLTLARETEADFLNAGEQVRSVSIRCKTNAANAAGIRESIESGKAWNSEEVDVLFSRAYEEMHEGTVTFSEALPGLRALGGRTQRIREVQNFLLRLTHSVKIMGGLIKLHRSQSGQTSTFHLLANAAKTLAGQVAEANRNMSQATAATRRDVRNALQLVKGMSPFRKELSLNRRETDVLSQDISGSVEEAAESCREIEVISQEIAPALTQVVMSLQYHDITRQQMEHIGQALQLLPEKLRSGPYKSGNTSALEIPDCLWSLRSIEIQIGQVHHVLHKTNEIASEVDRQFRSIFRQTRTQTGQANRILDQESDLVLGARRLHSGLQRLLELLMQSEHKVQDLTKNLEETGDHLEYVGHRLKQVEEIGLELKLLSINAMLQEESLTEESEESGFDAEGSLPTAETSGAKLSPEADILIQEIIKISGEAQHLLTRETVEVQNDLQEVQSFQGQLVRQLDQRLRATSENRKILAGYLESFVESGKSMIQAMREVSCETRHLEETIISLLEELSFEHLVQLKVGRVLRSLETLRNDLQSRLKSESYETEPPFPKAEDFDSIRANYTREIERQIHDTCLTQGLDVVIAKIAEGWKNEPCKETAPDESTAAEDDLFGDDIELF